MLKAYIILTFCLLADFILYLSQGISLVGQWPDKLLFWSWLVFTIVLIVRYNRKRWARVYTGFLIILVVLSMFPMGIPIISLIAFATYSESEIRVEKYTLQQYAESPIAIPKLAFIERNFLMERIIAKPELYLEIGEKSYSFADIDSVQLKPQKDSLVFTLYIDDKTIDKSISK